ncbi:MAG: hypothetical protein Q9200_003749 [Gallowayella weberi]
MSFTGNGMPIPKNVFWLFSILFSTNSGPTWKSRLWAPWATRRLIRRMSKLSSRRSSMVRTFIHTHGEFRSPLIRNVDYYLGTRRGAMFPFIGEGIFTQDNEAWRHSRELLRRPFLKTHYQDLKGFQEPINNLLSKMSSSKGVLDLQPLFFQFTLATTTALIFGQPVESSEDEDQDSFARSFDHASWITTLRSRLTDFYWLYNPAHYRAACKTIRGFADGFVNRALSAKDATDKEESRNDRYAFIEDLYASLKDESLVRDQLINILLAALRLYPPIPLNVRFANKTTWLPRGGGPDGTSPVLVPKGLGIGIVPYYMHRRKDIWGDDAQDYRPERWEDPELLQNIGYAYMPFHGGPRICLGKDFALTEASCLLIRILQSFPNIRLPPDDAAAVVPTGLEKQELTVFLKSAEGCRVVVS